MYPLNKKNIFKAMKRKRLEVDALCAALVCSKEALEAALLGEACLSLRQLLRLATTLGLKMTRLVHGAPVQSMRVPGGTVLGMGALPSQSELSRLQRVAEQLACMAPDYPSVPKNAAFAGTCPSVARPKVRSRRLTPSHLRALAVCSAQSWLDSLGGSPSTPVSARRIQAALANLGVWLTPVPAGGQGPAPAMPAVLLRVGPSSASSAPRVAFWPIEASGRCAAPRLLAQLLGAAVCAPSWKPDEVPSFAQAFASVLLERGVHDDLSGPVVDFLSRSVREPWDSPAWAPIRHDDPSDVRFMKMRRYGELYLEILREQGLGAWVERVLHHQPQAHLNRQFGALATRHPYGLVLPLVQTVNTEQRPLGPRAEPPAIHENDHATQ